MSLVKILTVSSLLVASTYAAGTGACKGCHGQQFEKKAMGTSKIVKDMSKEDIVKSLKGYKDGSYGGAMKGIMKGQVASLSDADMAAIADEIKGGGGDAKAAPAAAAAATSAVASTPAKETKAVEAAPAPKKIVDINAKSSDAARISKEDLGNKKEVTEEVLGLRKTSLFDENVEPAKTDYKRASAGSSDRFERAYVNAPPMIPHDVEGLLPITSKNNQCLGCHMPDAAKGVGATPIPPSHFTNYRPDTVYKNGELVKEGKTVGMKGELGNVSDIKLAKAKKLNHLYQGRFNCSQCHAPQAKVDTAVANTFQPDGLTDKLKSSSNLVDKINEGVK
jgi:cytochrome c-type protein NapB